MRTALELIAGLALAGGFVTGLMILAALELDRPMRDDEQCEVDAAAGGWRPRRAA